MRKQPSSAVALQRAIDDMDRIQRRANPPAPDRRGRALSLVTRARVEHVSSHEWLHVGQRLDLTLGSPSSTSFEGVGISVSNHPEEWAAIAKLGDRASTLARADGRSGRFAIYTRSISEIAAAWSIAEGWVTQRMGWEVSYVDDEDGDRRHFVLKSKSEAMNEMEEYEGQDPQIKQVTVLDAAPKMLTRWVSYFAGSAGRKTLGHHEVEVESLNLWLAASHPEIDGVWWKDLYDPGRLSAPRGVILPHAAPRWKVTRSYRLTGDY